MAHQVVHTSCYFEGEAKEFVLQLMRDQSSCARAAYQLRMSKTCRNVNEIRRNLISKYGKKLKVMMIYDAITRTENLKEPGVIFGSKKSWKELNRGKLDKNDWTDKRDSRFYASGDKRLKGNRSVRFDVNSKEIFVCSGTENGKWTSGKVWIPKKQLKKLDLTNYRVNLRYTSGNKFEADICFESVNPRITSPIGNGFIGVDTNPDGLGISETDRHGNLLFHSYLVSDKLKFANTDKRLNDARHLAKYLIDLAVRLNKPIAIEQLQFGKIKFVGRRFNRMRANFVYNKLIEAVKSRAARYGVFVKEVNPAYTSKLGKLKYKKMYSLSVHEAAALVIARRAAGLNERKDFSVSLIEKKTQPMKPKKLTKTNLTKRSSEVPKGMKPNLEQVRLVGRGFSMTVKGSSWPWLQRFLKPYPSSQDPLRHRVKETNPAYVKSNGLNVERASNRESRDPQQVGHAMSQINEAC